jgi:hypothetical protein
VERSDCSFSEAWEKKFHVSRNNPFGLLNHVGEDVPGALQYSGDDIDESTAEHCIAEAEHLIDDVASWRASKRPCLI